MSTARVTVMNVAKKANAIPRDRDNTLDLEIEEARTHARYSHLKAPQGTKNKSATKGSFDPTSDAAFNGNTVTAPPQT
jgi:hypothetical protein